MTADETAATPGQAAYEVDQAIRQRTWDDGRPITWEDLPDDVQANWEDIAQAAIDAFLAGDSVSAESIREALAAQDARPTPALREALEAMLKDWRDDAAYRPTDTRDEMSEHHAVSVCANTLAGILADYPETEPQPASELAAAVAVRDQARADRNRARNVVAEMAAHWQRIGATREEDELITQWLKIAGLTS